VRELDGLRIIGPADGELRESRRSRMRELISDSDTEGRWSFGEVIASPDPSVSTHIHPGEPEALLILEGEVELHGARGIEHLGPGDVVFVPPDTEHGLRTPTGGRWMAIWPINERVPGKRYAEQN
jgi:mannose-6-phosphate isomerase-like protein (cupin superfamily)